MRSLLAILLSLLFLSCREQVNKGLEVSAEPIDCLEIDYAKGFAVNYYEDHKELLVFSTDRKDTLHHFYLSNDAKEGYIQTPVKRFASLSSVYAAYIEALGLEEYLVAVDEKDYISSNSIRNDMEQRDVIELGGLDKMNHEALLMAQVDLVYSFGWQGNTSSIAEKHQNISFAYGYEYLEEHPLGRAEWIKFFACFFNKETEADSIFDLVKTNYENLKALTAAVLYRPKTLINMPFKERWHVPGGLSYSAHLIEDAGAYYPWDTLKVNRSIPMDWEVVYQKAYDSDYWINTGVYSSYAEVQKVMPDAVLFEAFRNKKAFNNNARMNGLGGNDYWESGLLYVDELLADLIVIFHPEILPTRALKYYKPLVDE
jgi:iron complex transport system substrate-binding protein